MGSINLSAYVNEDGKFDINSFEEDISIIVKAMNDVLDEGLPLHPLQIQRDTVRDYRQIGIGVMGIADMLIKMGIKYDEPKAIETCELIGFILANSHMNSIFFFNVSSIFNSCLIILTILPSFLWMIFLYTQKN